MADSLSINTIPWVKSFYKTSVGLSKNFNDTRQRKNFIAFLTSLILTGSPFLRDVGRLSASSKFWSWSLSHFLAKSRWIEKRLERKRKDIAIKLLKDCLAVAVDSTALVKTGKKFEYSGAVYDSRDNHIHEGFPLLIATGITNQGHYSPLLWQRWSKHYPGFMSENQIKERFLKELFVLLRNNGENPIFIADSGFCRKNIIDCLSKDKILFVIRTTPRLVRLISGKRALTSQLRVGHYRDIEIVNRNWNKFRCNLVVGGWDRNHKKRLAYLTNLSLKDYSRNQIVKLYQKRWYVEENIKQLKQYFGLESFRVRNWLAGERFLTLSFLAATLMHLSMNKHNLWIQYTLSSLLPDVKLEEKRPNISIYYCRQLLLKILFCGLMGQKTNVCLIKQANGP